MSQYGLWPIAAAPGGASARPAGGVPLFARGTAGQASVRSFMQVRRGRALGGAVMLHNGQIVGESFGVVVVLSLFPLSNEKVYLLPAASTRWRSEVMFHGRVIPWRYRIVMLKSSARLKMQMMPSAAAAAAVGQHLLAGGGSACRTQQRTLEQ